jgi:hypothetical protein
MSVSAVGGVNPVQSHVAVANVGKPESGEVPGAPDHDGDSDDARTQPPAAKVSGATIAGSVNVKA